jgi:hypothetical protein
MELTHDGKTDVVTRFCGKNSKNRFEPFLSAQLHNLSDTRRR